MKSFIAVFALLALFGFSVHRNAIRIQNIILPITSTTIMGKDITPIINGKCISIRKIETNKCDTPFPGSIKDDCTFIGCVSNSNPDALEAPLLNKCTNGPKKEFTGENDFADTAWELNDLIRSSFAQGKPCIQFIYCETGPIQLTHFCSKDDPINMVPGKCVERFGFPDIFDTYCHECRPKKLGLSLEDYRKLVRLVITSTLIEDEFCEIQP